MIWWFNFWCETIFASDSFKICESLQKWPNKNKLSLLLTRLNLYPWWTLYVKLKFKTISKCTSDFKSDQKKTDASPFFNKFKSMYPWYTLCVKSWMCFVSNCREIMNKLGELFNCLYSLLWQMSACVFERNEGTRREEIRACFPCS